MRKRAWVSAFLVAVVALGLGTAAPEASAKKDCGEKEEVELEIARIYWEYNSSGNDLGVHVFLPLAQT